MRGEVLIKPAKINGTGAVVYVPRKWLGWLVWVKCLRKNKGVS